MDDKPAFDPSKPFEAVTDKPAFDPSKPFEAASQPQQGSTATGVAKSLGVGLGEGAIGLAGLPGDAANLLARGSKIAGDYIGGKLGFEPSPELPQHSALDTLTSGGIQKGVESVTGPFYKPQGATEEIANKVGQFAPAVIGGPESLAAKIATRAVAPAVASEAAGKLTEGTPAQPYAELAGALVGAGGASSGVQKFNDLIAANKAAKLVPTAQEAKAASRALYQHPDVDAVQIHPTATSDLADTISSDLKQGPNSGFREANEPKVFNAVNELRTAADEGRPAKIADIDNVRQVLGGLAKEKDAIGQPTRQSVAASRAIDHLDDFLPNLRQSDLIAGDAARANDILDEARQNWATYKKSSQVNTTLANAELNAASSHSGANIQNATKQAFKPLLKNNAAKVASWTDEEKAALNSVVRGTWTGHAARAAGNLLGGGGGLGMLAGGAAGYEAGGLPGALAGAAAGRAFKMIGNASTRSAVNKLDFLIRARSPIAVKLAAQTPQIVQHLPAKSIQALRGLITADPTLAQLSQQSGQPVSQSNPQ